MNKRSASTSDWLKGADRFEMVLKNVVGRRLTYEALIGSLDAGTA